MKSTQEIINLDNKYILATYAPHNIVFVRGEGSTLFDNEGKEYLDFLAGIAVCALGHNNKKIVKAIKDQAKKLMLVSNYFYTEERGLLAEKLIKGTHFSKIFFTNSGAESNEAAFKIAKKYFNKFTPERYKIVTCNNSFHGRTIATVTATGQEKYNKPFRPMPEWFIYVPFNDKDALKKALADPTVGAFMVECIQGEGGVVPATQDFLSFARNETKKNGQLLILDEVQTGIMRTGKMYGYQNYKIKPDIMTLAKGLGGGFPIGACVVTEELAAVMEVGDHGTTFGSNPLACRVGLTVINEVKKAKMKEHILEVSNYLMQRMQALTSFPAIKEVRGMGLMIGLVIDDKFKAKDIVNALLTKGVVASSAGQNTLRLVPPLTITKEEINKMSEILYSIIKELI